MINILIKNPYISYIHIFANSLTINILKSFKLKIKIY